MTSQTFPFGASWRPFAGDREGAAGAFGVPRRVLTVPTLIFDLWRCRGCRLIKATATTSQPQHPSLRADDRTAYWRPDKRPRSFFDARCRGRASPVGAQRCFADRN